MWSYVAVDTITWTCVKTVKFGHISRVNWNTVYKMMVALTTVLTTLVNQVHCHFAKCCRSYRLATSDICTFSLHCEF